MKDIIKSDKIAGSKIHILERKGQKIPVMLDSDLAELYQTEPKKLNQASKRNNQRFQDRCFKLEKDEYIEILKKEGKEYTGRHLPTVYTEEGALALSSVLKGEKAEKIFSVLLDSFFIVKNILKHRPELSTHEDIALLKTQIKEIQKDIELLKDNSGVVNIGSVVNNGNGNFNIGKNQITYELSSYNDIIRLSTEILDNPLVKGNKEIENEINDAIVLATKKDGNKLLEKIESITTVMNNVGELSSKFKPLWSIAKAWLLSQIV